MKCECKYNTTKYNIYINAYNKVSALVKTIFCEQTKKVKNIENFFLVKTKVDTKTEITEAQMHVRDEKNEQQSLSTETANQGIYVYECIQRPKGV